MFYIVCNHFKLFLLQVNSWETSPLLLLKHTFVSQQSNSSRDMKKKKRSSNSYLYAFLRLQLEMDIRVIGFNIIAQIDILIS